MIRRSKVREIAYEIVYETLERGGHSDELFQRFTEDGKKSQQEKNFLRRLSYGTIERAIELDERIRCFAKDKKMDKRLRTILRMGVYEIVYMDAVPSAATCNEMVNLAKKKCSHYAAAVNGILRNVARENPEEQKEKILALKKKAEEKMAFEYSMPMDLVQVLVDSYGKKTTKKILKSFYEKEDITLRIHGGLDNLKKLKDDLMYANIAFSPCLWTETGLRVPSSCVIESLPGFQEGRFTVQDESSMLPVLAAGIQKDNLVLDCCSSPGGKALQAADVLAGTGLVSARDVSEKKLERIRENVKRLHATNVEMKVWDGAQPDPEWKERADVVLADVPCSGIGVIGKKPEIKYHALEHSRNLVPLQRQIVEGALSSLKVGGTFIYSTCTIHPAENEENVRWILANLPLKLESLDPFIPEGLRNKMTAEGMLTILPGVFPADGFFVARFRKV